MNRVTGLNFVISHMLACAPESSGEKIWRATPQRKPEPVDREALKREYDLIQKKQSTLSRSKRDAVVRQYEHLTNTEK